jgi:CDP-diacylglycerol--serine O-phosphatidyltransferase
MKKVTLLPNIITAFGLTCGLFVIFRMNMIGVGDVDERVLMATAGILILAAFADLLDGAIARVMKAESEFGGLFDSLADAITFGVAPSVVILKTLSIEPGTEISFLITLAAMVYTVCGVLRLIRFNVTNRQIKENEELLAASQKNFTGLPIPAAASCAVSLNLFLASPDLTNFVTIKPAFQMWVLFFALLFIGYLMVSRWRFPSLKTLRVRVGSFKVIFLTVVSAVFIFYGILHHFALVFFTISWMYLVASCVLSLIRVTTGKRSKTLEDFEPSPEIDEDDLGSSAP